MRNELKNKIRDNYTIIPNGLLSDDRPSQEIAEELIAGIKKTKGE